MVTKEKDAVIIAPEGNLGSRHSTEPTLHAPNAAQERTTLIVPEKPSEDGYNWRKYGQKNVKGREYVRSYYRCSYSNCRAKKQVERSHDGKISDISYLEKHDHPKPKSESREAVPLLLSPEVHTPDCPTPAGGEDKSSNIHPMTDDIKPKEKCELPAVAICYPTTPVSHQLSTEAKDDQNENLISKRRKKSVDGANFTVEKSGHESREVICSVSEVDVLNDGYRWRKYGQKMVKGNPNPRSYYRCSTSGCPVKKHVERASHDPKVVITTYEGEHDHSIPPFRTVLPHTTAPSAGPAGLNEKGKTKSEETDVAHNGTADLVAIQERSSTRMVITKPDVTSCGHVDQTSDSNQKMEDPVCQGPRSDNGDRSSKQDEIASEDQRTDHVDPTSEGQSNPKMEDPICKGLVSDKIDRSSNQEEKVLNKDAQVQGLSTEEQRKTGLDSDGSRYEAESNGEPTTGRSCGLVVDR